MGYRVCYHESHIGKLSWRKEFGKDFDSVGSGISSIMVKR
jgi:hypothetical protein